MQDYNTDHPFDLTLSEEQQMTWDMLRKFAETELRPQARQAESDGRPSSQLLDKIKSLDLISLIIPEAYGGIGLKQDAVSNALTLEALSYGDLSLAMSVSIPMVTAQIIAEHEKTLIGYALVMPKALKKSIPVLVPMFDLLDTLVYKGRPVKDLSFYVMGQICIAKEFRGQGVFQSLYAAHKSFLSKEYDYCITEISTSNLRSMKAHLNLGFEVLHRFRDPQDEWNIVLWDWTI